jgi:membrane fusion protein (multidrug efflux system)
VAFAALVLLACSRDEAPAVGQDGAPVVGVTVVELAPLREQVELVGELRSEESVVLRAEISGVLEEVGFVEGQDVGKGDVLLRLRDGEQRARLREEEARRALAADEFARTRRLADRDAAAAAQLERAAAELAVATARVEFATVELERTRIRAPFPGAVGARLVSPGERLQPETPLVRVDAVDPLQVVFTVPEAAVPQARAGASVSVEVAAYADERFEGEIFFVAPSIDQATRRLTLKARVPNPERRLRPGMFARVHMELGQREALLVPEEAVVHDRTGSFVWRVSDKEIAERIAVQLGVHRDGRVEIRSGLRAGERVVSSGTHKVYGGARVQAAPGRAAGQGGAQMPGGGALGGGGG